MTAEVNKLDQQADEINTNLTVMKFFLDLLCFCLLILAGKKRCDENGPAAIRVSASEGGDVVLPCSLSTNENIEKKLFDWRKDGGRREVFMYDAGLHHNNGLSGQDEQFRGRVFHFRDELKNGVASVIIRNTKMLDSGEYTCFFPRLQPPQIFHIELVVAAAPKPSFKIFDATDDGVQLQCEVRDASSNLKLEWRDRAGNVVPAGEPQTSERGGSYDIVLQTTVTKTGIYRCVATQQAINHQTINHQTINHQTHAEIYVYITGSSTRERIKAFIFGAAFVVLFIVVVVNFALTDTRRRFTRSSTRIIGFVFVIFFAVLLAVALAQKSTGRSYTSSFSETKEHDP